MCVFAFYFLGFFGFYAFLFCSVAERKPDGKTRKFSLQKVKKAFFIWLFGDAAKITFLYN
jgi:hypothetical protein